MAVVLACMQLANLQFIESTGNALFALLLHKRIY